MTKKSKKNTPEEKDAEAGVSYSFIVENLGKSMDEFTSAVRQKYSERILNKKHAYIEVIEFLRSSGATLNIDTEEINFLKKVFNLRNTITHENGFTPAGILSDIRDATRVISPEPHVGADDIKEVSNMLFAIGVKIDLGVKKSFYSREVFVFSMDRFTKEFALPQAVMDKLAPIVFGSFSPPESQD